MKLEDMNLQAMIDNAEKNRACRESLEKLRKFSSMEGLLEIASDEEKAEWAYWYAENVIKGRWLEAEPFIIKDAFSAYVYAKYIIKGRWLEAEPSIMKDAYSAYLYARDVIEDRWPEAESIIKRNGYYWGNYYHTFPEVAKE